MHSVLMPYATLKFQTKEHARLLIFNIFPPLLALIPPARLRFFGFSLKTHMELLQRKQHLFFHGKVYISSQTELSAI